MDSFVNTLIMKNLSKYLLAGKSEKSKIIDNIVLNTSLHRKSVIRRLHRSSKQRRKRGGSKKKYLPETEAILKLVWPSRDYICAELLQPYLAESIGYLRKYGLLNSFSTLAISQVVNMPLGTLKIKLKSLNIVRPDFSYYRRTGNQLKKQIAVNTQMNNTTSIGYLELDFVDHNGGNSSGQFCRTLCCVDILSQFVVRKATRGKAEARVQNIFHRVLENIPFKIKALHTDNEVSLLKSLLLQQAKRQGIHISRSRSYQKQDNGHVEQKNGDKIRMLVGYRRYGSDKQTKLLNQIYACDDLLQNHFIPSRRLVEKLYDLNGKLIAKKWDKAKTPYQRVVEAKGVSLGLKSQLMSLHKRLNPLQLKEQRDNLLKKLRNLSVTH